MKKLKVVLERIDIELVMANINKSDKNTTIKKKLVKFDQNIENRCAPVKANENASNKASNTVSLD